MQDWKESIYGDELLPENSYFSMLFDSNFFITYTMEYYSKLRDEDNKKGNKLMDNFDYLTEVLNDYCIKYNLPIDMSADDMIYYFYNNDDSFKENPYHFDRF